MAAPTFLTDRYAPLNLQQRMNAMPQEYLKLLPHFTGEDEVATEKKFTLVLHFC